MYRFICQACGGRQFSSAPNEDGSCVYCGAAAVKRETPGNEELQKDLHDLARQVAQISAKHGGIYVTAVMLAGGEVSIAMANPAPNISLRVQYDIRRDLVCRR